MLPDGSSVYLTESFPLLESTIADRYRLEAEIGRGSFSKVYRAVDLHTGQTVALKILDAGLADETLWQRLQREAQLMQRLQSPHCVRIHELIESAEGQHCLVMECLEGMDLAQWLERYGALTADATIDIARQILSVLSEAHTLGIVHRDLKPHNVFLCTGSGGLQVKVLDFGIAKVLEGGRIGAMPRLTVAGGVLGTVVYMSPEQCRGEPVTIAGDIYSMGIMLYEMLTGNVPFDDSNPVKIMLKHTNDPVPSLPHELRGTHLEAAVLRALEKAPARRYKSAAEFAVALAETTIRDSASLLHMSRPIPQSPRSLVPEPSFAPPPYSPPSLGFAALLKRHAITLAIVVIVLILALSQLL